MARRPREYRRLRGKVDPETGEASPCLYLCGKHLTERGFDTGDIVSVDYREREIHIRWVQSGRHLPGQVDLFDWHQEDLIDVSLLDPQHKLFEEEG